MANNYSDNIKNSTLTKLTWVEIGDLGLHNQGIFTFKGILKTRVKGYKTEKDNDYQTNVSTEGSTLEFIKIVSTDGTDTYALRVKDNLTNRYSTYYPVLWGCDFFK